ncbi:unnamed protein product [Penicillium nalgiovense]|nr:unnamed protein product [Penicillium nalgiovense]CAG8033555.1 unnamed protein product [Penicillium nalgiovense]CAG8036065.1 unnamed protein product [Penicillium nalgiovense]
MSPLRAHAKSCNGCDQCRSRRVKCDEQPPPPVATTHVDPPSSTSDVPRYLGGHGSPVVAMPGLAVLTIQVPAPAQTNSFGIDNLELMHKFVTNTHGNLCVSDSEIKIWQLTVPTLAFKHDYLMSRSWRWP